MTARTLPSNFGPLRSPSGNARITGPCGDTMEFWIRLDDEIITQCSYTTDGCIHSILCGSAAARLAEGKRLDDACSISQLDVLNTLKGIPDESRHCALLAANTLKAAIDNHQKHLPAGRNGGCASPQKNAPIQKPGIDEGLKTIRERMKRIRHKIIVLSGKGGVGKSTTAVNLAVSLAMAGKQTGLLDTDIHGPSVPRMITARNVEIVSKGENLMPAEVDGIRIMSIGFLLRERDDPVIWRGPMKTSAIRQFLGDVEWGDLDFLIVDAPPGTGDEPLSVCQFIGDADGAVIVSTPQSVAVEAVRKSIVFCRQLHLPVLGVIENMSGFVCPKCGEVTNVFNTGGGEAMAREMGVPFLGRIPLDSSVGISGDEGTPFVRRLAGTPAAQAFTQAAAAILNLDNAKPAPSPETTTPKEKENIMRIAIPTENGKLCPHFGHCEHFAIIETDPKTKTIVRQKEIPAPEHEPGLLPKWLAEKGVRLVIAGGMGQRAQALFREKGIDVKVGAPAESAEALVLAHLKGTLETGDNACDH